MSFLFWGLLSVLAALLAVLIAAVVMPVRLGCSLRSAPGWRARVVVRPFAGLTPDIPVFDSARRSRRAERPAARNKKRAARSRRQRQRQKQRSARAASAAPRLIAQLLRAIHLERLTIDADFGLADPAETGQLFGLAAAFKHAVRPRPPMSIDLRPDFTGPRLSGVFEAQLRFTPAAFIPPGIRFARHMFQRR